MVAETEVCCGCGVAAEKQPWTAVMRGEGGAWMACPCCTACHRDPTHRTLVLKAHFFARDAAAVALASVNSPGLHIRA